jgi:hypothetical protein
VLLFVRLEGVVLDVEKVEVQEEEIVDVVEVDQEIQTLLNQTLLKLNK